MKLWILDADASAADIEVGSTRSKAISTAAVVLVLVCFISSDGSSMLVE